MLSSILWKCLKIELQADGPAISCNSYSTISIDHAISSLQRVAYGQITVKKVIEANNIKQKRYKF